jgi:hypothetical protein
MENPKNGRRWHEFSVFTIEQANSFRDLIHACPEFEKAPLDWREGRFQGAQLGYEHRKNCGAFQSDSDSSGDFAIFLDRGSGNSELCPYRTEG